VHAIPLLTLCKPVPGWFFALAACKGEIAVQKFRDMSINSELEQAISSLYCEGCARYGDLGLDLQIFTDRIEAIVRKHLGALSAPGDVLAFVRGLHGRDLYLASACAQYAPGGGNRRTTVSAHVASIPWKIFETTYRSHIHNLARFFHRAGTLADDLADNVLADLFLPDRSGVSRIASYDGRSSLNTWLRVIVCNRAINARRSNIYNSQPPEIGPEIADEPALNSIELAVRAAKYGPALQDSLASACRGLSPRERLILLWRYEHGLQLGQIGRLLGIHQSNVTRQLERTQNKLRDEVITILSERHGLSRLAIEECLQDVVDNPSHDISLLKFIKLAQEFPVQDDSENS
jgi:RNA polymerase sigma-70 factor